MVQKETYIFKGMNRDTNPMAVDSSLAYEIRNMRISVNKTDNSLLMLTNEKGPKKIDNAALRGNYLGHAVLNNYLVLFSEGNNTDYIDVIEFNNDGTVKQQVPLVKDGVDLNFKTGNPIETLSLYENDKLQKVYFVDGVNSPRVVNLVNSEGQLNVNFYTEDNKTLLDFCVSMNLSHKLEITKSNLGGTFPTGIVQYIFSYFNYGMQESHLFEISPLYYLSKKERGDLTTELQSCSFSIKLTNLDSNFKYVRCYAIVTTSKNATPVCRIVGDYSIENKTVSIFDNGAIGSTVDVTKLFYIGGQNFVAGTLTQKSNTLFLGNITNVDKTLKLDWKNFHIDPILVDYNGNKQYDCYWNGSTYVYRQLNLTKPLILEDLNGTTTYYVPKYPGDIDDYYNYTIDNNRPSTAVKRFKAREYYKYGIVAQYKDGSFSDVQSLGIFNSDISPIFIQHRLENTTEYGITTPPSGTNEAFFEFKDTSAYASAEPCFLTSSMRLLIYGDDALKELTDKGIIKIYPVVVYPTDEYRSVITQGFVSPTVFKVSERYDNIPFAEASWLYRFYNSDKTDFVVPNAYHYGSLYPSMNLHSELGISFIGGLDVQGTDTYIDRLCSPIARFSYLGEADSNRKDDIINYLTHSQYNTFFGQEYLQDCNLLTLNSPETELGLLDNIDMSNLHFRFCGFSSFIKNGIKVNNGIFTKDGADLPPIDVLDSILSNSWLYTELDVINSGTANYVRALNKNSKKNALPSFGFSTKLYAYHYFMDHNVIAGAQGIAQGDLDLKKSVKSNLHCGYTNYQGGIINSFDTKNPQLFNSTQVTPLYLKDYDDSNPKFLYYGNYSSIKTNIGYTIKDLNNDTLGAKHVIGFEVQRDMKDDTKKTYTEAIESYSKHQWKYIHNPAQEDLPISTSLYFYQTGGSADPLLNFAIDKSKGNPNNPLEIKYKSTPHIVFSLGYKSNSEYFSHPVISAKDCTYGKFYENDKWDNTPLKLPFWFKDNDTLKEYNANNIFADGYSGYPSDMWYAGLFIGEFYRKESEIGIVREGDVITNKGGYMGGDENEKFLHWVICGDPIDITEHGTITYYYNGSDWSADTNNRKYLNGVTVTNKGIYELIFTEGDTYVGRYDSLKTYPFDESTGNGVIEIYSSELESRVNLDERVDRNRGLVDNTTVRPYTNFNIFNDTAYNQDRDLFNYQTADTVSSKILSFPNQVTWSLEKTLGEDVDTWTQIPLTSIMDLDGDKGELNYLTTFNDTIFSFQDKGIAQILFNERVQIPTSDNNPIEITNGYKVSGKRYLSDDTGCQNKWSIAKGDSGIYFVDNIRSMAYLFNGSVPTPISYTAGLQTYFNNINSLDKWYSDTNLYKTKAIRSFYDNVRKEVYYVGKSESLVYSEITNTFTSLFDYNNLMLFENINNKNVILYNTNFYSMFDGNYNVFPDGSYKTFFIDFYSNIKTSPINKTFSNIEWQSIIEDRPDNTWDKLEVSNPYQNANHTLTYVKNGRMNTLEKKFNVWRTYFPRTTDTRGRSERISYIYANIKLSSELALSDSFKFELYNTSVTAQV